MSGYEVEHNISTESTPQLNRPIRRPDLSTFFSTLELVDTSPNNERQGHNNSDTLPEPDNMVAAYRLLANAFEMMRGGGGDQSDEQTNELLQGLIETLRQGADDPPREFQGVPDSFLDGLDRVPKKSLKKSDTCPICALPFLEDEYPLVVCLPCHPDHKFDLDCIRPWLKLNPTCPLDRKVLLKKKEPLPLADDEEDGEYDEMYA